MLGDGAGNEILNVQLLPLSLRTLSGQSQSLVGPQFPLCPKALDPGGEKLARAQALLTSLLLPAQSPGPGRVLRCRASTACPAL